MADFRKTQPRRYALLEERDTEESRFWRSFRNPVVTKQHQAITHLDVSPVSPYDYAVTSGMQLTLYDGKQNVEKRVLSRFKEPVYSGVYRGDGRLLACGTEKGLVCILDASSRNILRTLRGHGAAVRTVRFTGGGGGNNIHVASAGDDGSLRHWDLTTGECLSSVEGAHGDYIRSSSAGLSGGSGLLGGNVLATGSYDHRVRLWDLRMMGGGEGTAAEEEARAGGPTVMLEDGEEEEEDEVDSSDEEAEGEEEEEEDSSDEEGGGGGDEDEEDEEEDEEEEEEEEEESAKQRRQEQQPTQRKSARPSPLAPSLPRGCILSVDHGEPITSVVLHNSTVVSSSGTGCKVWDILNAGQHLTTFNSHTKAVTAAALDGTGTRYVTCGLDGLVKVHTLGTYSVVHTARFAGQLLALAIPSDNSRLMTGGVDGTLWVRQRNMSMEKSLVEKRESGMLREGSFKYFMRGRSGGGDPEDQPAYFSGGGGAGGGASSSSSSAFPAARKPVKLKAYDKALQAFDHAGALDAALATHSPGIIAAILRELLSRGALRSALSGRTTGEEVEPLLSFLAKHIPHPRYSSLCADVMGSAADVFVPLMEMRGGGGGGGGSSGSSRGGGDAPGSHGRGRGGELRRDGITGLLESHFTRIRAALRTEVDLGAQLLSLQGQLDMLLANASR